MFALIPNKKGFTLIEVLLIIALLGILGTAAVSSYLDSTKTFTFFERYQSVISSVRAARSEAITNKQVYVGGNLVKPDNYGVSIAKNGKEYEINVFADTGDKPFEFDAKDVVRRVVKISEPYIIKVENNKNASLEFPLELFYETGTGKLMSYSKGALLGTKGNKYLLMKFSDSDKHLSKFIVVFQVSGLAEEFLTDPKL